MKPQIGKLPIDERSGLPVPWVTATLPNGRPNFSVIEAGRIPQLVAERLCGVCGAQRNAWSAFIGGPSAVVQNAFLDPPMHPQCAQDSLHLCPHIARQLPVHRADGKVQPDAWYLYVCKKFREVPFQTIRQENTRGFACEPPAELYRYHYVNGALVLERQLTVDDPVFDPFRRPA